MFARRFAFAAFAAVLAAVLFASIRLGAGADTWETLGGSGYALVFLAAFAAAFWGSARLGGRR